MFEINSPGIVRADGHKSMTAAFNSLMSEVFRTGRDNLEAHRALYNNAAAGCNYLVMVGNDIVGGFTLGSVNRKKSWLSNLAIRHDRQGHGYGKHAVLLAEGIARQTRHIFLGLNASEDNRGF